MNLLIVGLGTIGEPLAKLFLEMKDHLGINVTIHKNTPERKYCGMLKRFYDSGAHLTVNTERVDEFRKMLQPFGFGPSCTFDEALDKADVVIDCTKDGVGRVLKISHYERFNNGRRMFVAQGSEKGFGKPYAYGMNDISLDHEKDHFVQVVSCNTHQILSVLQTISGGNYDNIKSARVVLIRRASDIAQKKSIVGVEVVSPTHPQYGTHQGEDAACLLKTINVSMDLHSCTAIINSPFMHVIEFDITLRVPTSRTEIEKLFRQNPLTAVTYWDTNNEVFGEGRDWGHFGRILNQTVFCLPSLEVSSNGLEVFGTCFTPQDGNALLSSVAVALWFRDPTNYCRKMMEHFYKLPFLFDEV